LPKPLLPINGRPLLWYALNLLNRVDIKRPIVSIAYLSNLIKAYFEREDVTFMEFTGCSMAETMIRISETDDSFSFLGLSSDVLITNDAVDIILQDYINSNYNNSVLFTKLPIPGHKKWEFRIENGFLTDIIVRETKTNFERILLILSKDSLTRIRKFLGESISESSLPKELINYQTGWTLLLKVLTILNIKIHARIIELPIWNINTPNDFGGAEKFVKENIELFGSFQP